MSFSDPVGLLIDVLLVITIYLWIVNSKEDENLFLKRVLNKIQIYLDSILFMVLSKDNKGVGVKKNPDPDLIKDKETMTKTIIFIRHGESDWNDVFNKGINPGMISRMFKAWMNEMKLFHTNNSVFIDSPLNHDGILQAVELSKYVQSPDAATGQPEAVVQMLDILKGKSEKSSIVVSSSLRRAIATTTVGLWPRIQETNEKIHILSSLQEISRNIDTYSISAPKTVADLPFDRIHPYCNPDTPFNPDAVYNTEENFGQKKRSFYGIKRFKAFNEWIFARKEDAIIVGGHSLWFKYFFQTYLPHHFHHDAKNKKIANSGVVAFTLHAYTADDGEKHYRIEPTSLVSVYGGFTSK